MTYQQDVQERAQASGVRMDQPLLPGDITEMRDLVDHGVAVDLDSPGLAKVVRLRLIGYNRYEFPWWDISYCWGELKPTSSITLKEGRKYVRVTVPIRLGRFVEKQLIEWGRRNHVYIKGLGILDGDVISKQYG